MHCLLHLNESLNLEDFLSLFTSRKCVCWPFLVFYIIDRNDRFLTLSYASNNEIQAIFLKPVKGTPFVRSFPLCSAQRNNLVQQETRGRMVDILFSFSLQKQLQDICQLHTVFPQIIAVPRLIASPLSSCQVLRESHPVKLISTVKIQAMEHLKIPCSVHLM